MTYSALCLRLETTEQTQTYPVVHNMQAKIRRHKIERMIHALVLAMILLAGVFAGTLDYQAATEIVCEEVE